MDAVANVVTSTFLYSNNMRRDTTLTLLLVSDPERALRVRLEGTGLRYLNPDERSTAALLKNAIQRFWGNRAAAEREGETPVETAETSPGIWVARSRALEDLSAFAREPGTLWLHERGTPFPEVVGGSTARAILSDPYEFTPPEQELLEGIGLPKVSLGPLALHTAQCVTIIHNRLDRQSF